MRKKRIQIKKEGKREFVKKEKRGKIIKEKEVWKEREEMRKKWMKKKEQEMISWNSGDIWSRSGRQRNFFFERMKKVVPVKEKK